MPSLSFKLWFILENEQIFILELLTSWFWTLIPILLAKEKIRDIFGDIGHVCHCFVLLCIRYICSSNGCFRYISTINFFLMISNIWKQAFVAYRIIALLVQCFILFTGIGQQSTQFTEVIMMEFLVFQCGGKM